MRTLDNDHFNLSLKLEYLNTVGQARPVGQVSAREPLVMVRSDVTRKVVYLGPVPKESILVWP